MVKLMFEGTIFTRCGIPTANRNIVKALLKQNVAVQINDFWTKEYSEEYKKAYTPIDATGEDTALIKLDYPNHWRCQARNRYAYTLHEGTKLPVQFHPKYFTMINKTVFVPSKATKNLLRTNYIHNPIEVIPYGVDPEVFNPNVEAAEIKGLKDKFVFLFVNSWRGIKGDRKGADILLRAFSEEFKKDEKVHLHCKFSTFWQGKFDIEAAIKALNLPEDGPTITFDDTVLKKEQLAMLYRMADCVVSPTMAESFGLTICEAMHSKIPVIVTKDYNSGHMDYCNKDNSLLIEVEDYVQGDPWFYIEGNLLAKPSLESLKKQMRYAFEHREEIKKMAEKAYKDVKHLTWENTAKKLVEYIEKDLNGTAQ